MTLGLRPRTSAGRDLMLAYILRRLMLVMPTLFGIMVLNFFIIQAAPGGPVEQMIAQIQGTAVGATERFSGSASGGETVRSRQPSAGGGEGAYRGARGLPKELIQRIEKMYGFDKPIHRALLPDDEELSRLRLRRELLPQPPRRRPRASRRCRSRSRSACGRRCSSTSSRSRSASPRRCATARASTSRPRPILVVLNAIPGFLFALLLIVLFAGGSYFKWFPLRGLVSDDWSIARHDRQGPRLFLAHRRCRSAPW